VFQKIPFYSKKFQIIIKLRPQSGLSSALLFFFAPLEKSMGKLDKALVSIIFTVGIEKRLFTHAFQLQIRENPCH